MYKSAQQSQDYLARTGSHATKSNRSLKAFGSARDYERWASDFGLAEARAEQQLMKHEYNMLVAKAAGTKTKDENSRQNILACGLSAIRRRIAALQELADLNSDYQCFMRAITEVCGEKAATLVLARKIELQAEQGEMFSVPKPNGSARKPIAERQGGTMEQVIAAAIAKATTP